VGINSGPKKYFDWRGCVVFVVVTATFGYVTHKVTGVDLRASMALAAVGVLVAGLMATFGDKP
jgi:hypothetical protein